MKISELLQINSLQEKIQDKKLPIKTAYKFNKLFQSVQEDITFFNTTLQKIIYNYGLKDENGNYVLTEDQKGVKIQEDKKDECMVEIQELNNLDSELKYIPHFTIEELDTLELSVQELSCLMPFIEE